MIARAVAAAGVVALAPLAVHAQQPDDRTLYLVEANGTAGGAGT